MQVRERDTADNSKKTNKNKFKVDGDNDQT